LKHIARDGVRAKSALNSGCEPLWCTPQPRPSAAELRVDVLVTRYRCDREPAGRANELLCALSIATAHVAEVVGVYDGEVPVMSARGAVFQGC
jgi:hypothetical protein